MRKHVQTHAYTGRYQCVRCGKAYPQSPVAVGVLLFCTSCVGVPGIVVRRPGVGDRVWIGDGLAMPWSPPSFAHYYVCKVGTVREVRRECIGSGGDVFGGYYEDAYAITLDGEREGNELSANTLTAVLAANDLQPISAIAPWRVWLELNTRSIRYTLRRWKII
jgi:hypothetical protein